MTIFNKLKTSTRGATAVDYGIIVGLLSGISIGVIYATGANLPCVFQKAAVALGSDISGSCRGDNVEIAEEEEHVHDPSIAIERDPGAPAFLLPMAIMTLTSSSVPQLTRTWW